VAAALPIAALADVTGTPTLTANTALSLDTGTAGSSGGDILWSGSSLTSQGNAGIYNIGNFGPVEYAELMSGSILSAFPGSLYSKSAVAASALPVGDVFAVQTNGGNYAKVLVTAVNGTSISLQFDTFGVSTGPTITQILNNYGLVPAGFSNSGIAPGSLFIVKGAGLANPAAQALPLQDPTKGPLPTTLNGASVQITSNGVTVTPVFYYAIAVQLALVLPSNTPAGSATLTVSYGGQTSAPASFQVVQNAMGFDTYYGTGSGLGVAQNYQTGALYNYTSPIPPGATVQLWGSGLGADPARDTTFNPAVVPINNLSHIYIGGLDATILYQGGSGYPGLNQIDVTIPAGVAMGCNVSLVGVNAAGVPTNFLSLPIGNGVCADPAFGTTGAQLQNGSGQTTVNTGLLYLAQSTSPASSGSGTETTTNVTDGIFESVTGTSYGTGSGSVSVGGCVAGQSATAGTVPTITGLNAGSISVTGPNGAASLTEPGTGLYEGQLASGFIPSSGGTFTFTGTGGTGAASIGAFTTSVTFPSPLLVWSNTAADATITRGSGATFSWTGGAAGTYVVIGGSSTGTSSGGFGSFICIAPVAAGQFTVPSYVLSALPAGTGSTSVANVSSYGTFSAPGLNAGAAFGEVSQSIGTTFK
jgi:uncharacterized protein (TIGR03437 family)